MKTILFLTVLLFGSAALGYGENKLGPNGGYIRMPGAFHTEVVPQGENQIRVYLLDINGKNPSVTSSSLKTAVKGKTESVAECKVQTNYFLCGFGKETDLAQGRLILRASRENKPGKPAIYDLPLRLEGSGHSSAVD